MRKITAPPLEKCPDCGGGMRKKVSNTSFVLKGTGWYVTDYAADKKKTDSAAKSGGKAEKASESRIEGVEKPEARTEAKESPKTDGNKSEAKEVRAPGKKEATASS